MRLDKKDIILIFIILSLFIGDLLIYSGIINLFFKDKETIWAGIIAFTGAIFNALEDGKKSVKAKYRYYRN
ncbi:hypothetical protein [Bacillus altitudinis]|uniref:hypothetical protein n=1 Tax=Bacillus altitudinis TaxID=293387 RepID=UPI003F56F224